MLNLPAGTRTSSMVTPRASSSSRGSVVGATVAVAGAAVGVSRREGSVAVAALTTGLVARAVGRPVNVGLAATVAVPTGVAVGVAVGVGEGGQIAVLSVRNRMIDRHDAPED